MYPIFKPLPKIGYKIIMNSEKLLVKVHLVK